MRDLILHWKVSNLRNVTRTSRRRLFKVKRTNATCQINSGTYTYLRYDFEKDLSWLEASVRWLNISMAKRFLLR